MHCNNANCSCRWRAHRPVVPGKEPGVPPKDRFVLTPVQKITDFRHPNAHRISSVHELPPGEGEFQVTWRGHKQQDWIKGDDIRANGPEAVNDYFQRANNVRQANIKHHMQFIPHISSLSDIIPAGIVEETGNKYKIRIGSLSLDFLHELDHPIWGKKKITKLFDIVREGTECFVLADKIQVQYICPNSVINWSQKQLDRLTMRKIPGLVGEYIDYGRRVTKKDGKIIIQPAAYLNEAQTNLGGPSTC